MAVSGSVDFKLTGSEMIIAARRVIGIHSEEEALEASDLVTGLQRLTMMLKAWQVDGVMTWSLTEGQLTLVASTNSYVFGSGGTFTTVPLEITQMRITRSSNDLEMNRLSREEYYALPNKTSTGYPTNYYYDRQRSGGMLYVWPSPDTTAGTLKFTYRRLINDMDGAANDLDIPQEWHEAILYNLADRFAEDYGGVDPDVRRSVAVKAVQSYAVVKGFDAGEGQGFLTIRPDWTGSGRY